MKGKVYLNSQGFQITKIVALKNKTKQNKTKQKKKEKKNFDNILLVFNNNKAYSS